VVEMTPNIFSSPQEAGNWWAAQNAPGRRLCHGANCRDADAVRMRELGHTRRSLKGPKYPIYCLCDKRGQGTQAVRQEVAKIALEWQKNRGISGVLRSI